MVVLQALIDSVWTILNLHLRIDNYTFTLWQFILFPLLVGIAFNLIFGKSGGDSN